MREFLNRGFFVRTAVLIVLTLVLEYGAFYLPEAKPSAKYTLGAIMLSVFLWNMLAESFSLRNWLAKKARKAVAWTGKMCGKIWRDLGPKSDGVRKKKKKVGQGYVMCVPVLGVLVVLGGMALLFLGILIFGGPNFTATSLVIVCLLCFGIVLFEEVISPLSVLVFYGLRRKFARCKCGNLLIRPFSVREIWIGNDLNSKSADRESVIYRCKCCGRRYLRKAEKLSAGKSKSLT